MGVSVCTYEIRQNDFVICQKWKKGCLSFAKNQEQKENTKNKKIRSQTKEEKEQTTGNRQPNDSQFPSPTIVYKQDRNLKTRTRKRGIEKGKKESQVDHQIMVYLENSDGTKFWSCRVVADNNVETSYGSSSSGDGRKPKTITDEFDNVRDARSFVIAQANAKRNDKKDPYHDVSARKKRAAPAPLPVVTPTKPKKSKATTTAAAPAPAATATKKYLKGHAAPNIKNSKEEEVTVDSGVAGLDSAVASRVKIHTTYHARLALIDASKNSDKYYILQALVDEEPPSSKKKKTSNKRQNSSSSSSDREWYLFTRWGRTGTSGQAKLDGPYTEESKCEEEFEKMFKSKTGIAWGQAIPGSAPQKGKYEYLAVKKKQSDDDDEEEGTWYYYLKDDPLGKADGWYPYDEDNSKEAEDLYQTYLASKQATRLARRVITSDSNGFQYLVDLKAMSQTNVSSGTSRPIGRTENGKPPVTAP